MKKRKIIGIITASILILNFSSGNAVVRAQPVSSGKAIEEINALDKQISGLENQMELTDDKIQNNIIEIKKNTDNINEINDSIKSIGEEINNREETLEVDEINNQSAVKAMYENGGSTTVLLDTILNSKDFSEIISKTTAVNKVLTANKEIMKKVYEDKKYIENKRNKLFLNRGKVEKLLDENKDNLNKLNLDKSEQTEALSKLNLLKISLGNSISSPVNVYKEGISLGHLIYGDDNIANYAKNFLGVPYLWGGVTPDGFDCSGFIQYVYGHFKVNIPRTTYDQVNAGTTVKDNLKPGDLIFFGDKVKPHHVGMYIGDGEYIQAPHTGDYIKISPIEGSGYSVAKRILPADKK